MLDGVEAAASTLSIWIANLQPQAVLISVSAADKEGMPAPETLELLQGYTVLRTDQDGWIDLSTDGM